MSEVAVLARHQRQDGVECDRLLVLVKDLNGPFDHAGRLLIGGPLFLQRFTFTGEAHLNGIARLNRFDKAQVSMP